MFDRDDLGRQVAYILYVEEGVQVAEVDGQVAAVILKLHVDSAGH